MKYVFLLFLPLLAFAQGGNVVLNGTIISGNGTPATGYGAANTLDGNPLTAFAAPPGTGNGPWVGIDAGQAVTLVSVIASPRAGDASQIWALAWSGCIIEADVVSNFATAVTLYTFPSWATGLPDVYSGLMKTIPMSPSQAYRYYRFRDPVSHGNVGELRFVVQYVSGLTAMPVAPVITPGGGAFLSGSVTVSMSTATTGSTIYYTTNGTAPACGTSTLYSAPFALTVSNPPTQVQAVACNSGLSTTQSLDLGNQYYRGYGWNAGDQMYDDSGNEMETHAGSMLWAEGKWWWIGMNQSWGGSVANWALGHPGLWLYSSPDMYTWTKVGQNVTNLGVVNVERPHVIYNALHKQLCDVDEGRALSWHRQFLRSRADWAAPLWTLDCVDYHLRSGHHRDLCRLPRQHPVRRYQRHRVHGLHRRHEYAVPHHAIEHGLHHGGRQRDHTGRLWGSRRAGAVPEWLHVFPGHLAVHQRLAD